jgi:hypothetical protein
MEMCLMGLILDAAETERVPRRLGSFLSPDWSTKRFVRRTKSWACRSLLGCWDSENALLEENALSMNGKKDELWIKARLAELKRSGVEGVRIEVLAKSLGVTKGGFYRHFKSRTAPLSAMLADWALAALRRPSNRPPRRRDWPRQQTILQACLEGHARRFRG